MTTLDNTSKASASSEGSHDPALERSGPADVPATTPGSGNANGAPSTGDGGLHLQNAHFGALKVGEGNAPAATDGAKDDAVATGSDKTATPASGNDSQAAKPTEDLAAKAGTETNNTSGAATPNAPSGNSGVVQSETFSIAGAKNGAPSGASAELGELPQAPAPEKDENEAPTDIELSNTTIAENAAGAVVGALTTIDPDVAETFRYTLSDDRFEVVDGLLKLKDGISLDHEGEPSLTITVTATDTAGHSFTESFTINVANVNETPTDIALSNMTVAENAAGAVIGTLTTVDPDAGDSHTYNVSDDRFEVVGGQLKLKDGIALDHESEPSVTVQVTSTDAGGLQFSESFTLTVQNVNETPTDIALSNSTVAENAAGAVIGTLTTTDPDASDSFNYTVSDNRFEVVGGQLKLKDGISLDYEAEPTVTVQVTTTDAGGLTYSENFSIAVENVNETPTDIALSNATVAENAAGAVIGTLTTTDPDAGDSFNYTVSDNRFEVVGGQLKLKDGISLDFEAEPSVSIQVTSTDAGGLSYSENFSIAVQNVNETPTDIALSNASVDENAAGAVIGTLTTTDPDAGDSFNYTVSDNRFEVVGGQLKLKDGISLDYEAEPSVTIQVTTTDAGGLSYSENFSIAVQNVNETPIDIALSNASVAENAAGAVIGTLTTTDPDAGDSFNYTVSDDRFEVVGGQLKLKDGISLDHEAEPSVSIQVTTTDAGGLSYSENFSIAVQNVNEAPTDIALSNANVAENAAGAVIGTLTTTNSDAGDTFTYTVSDNRFEVVGGQLKLKDGVSLDYEAEPAIAIQVTATDAGGLSYNETFALTVTNAGDSPTDIALSNSTVAENAAGAVIGTLTTTDPDAGDSHTYSVSDGRFEVVNGELKLKAGIALDHEAGANVTVQVTATDAGGLTYSENFTINVTNVNEGPTDIALSNSNVAENAAGAVVGTLSTVDPDAGDSHSYAVSDSRFEVVGGQLKLKAGISLDREAEPNVAVQVTTTDAGGQTYSENFTITVGNVNESPFDISLSIATVPEIVAGAVVCTLTTADPDVGDTHSYVVSDARFEVVGGQLKLKAGISLDFELTPSITLGITATDAGGLSFTKSLTIGVTDGVDIINGTSGNNTLNGTVGMDVINGLAGNDTINGNMGDDVIVGGTGNDTLNGGGGSDTYRYTTGDGFDAYADNGILGTDRIVAMGANTAIGLASGFGTASGIEEISADGFANVTVTGGTGNDTLNFSTTTLTGIARILGDAGNDTITGSAGNDTIDGGAGTDTLVGGAGDDTLIGGAGNDSLNGGAGSDTYRYTTGDGFDTYADNGTSGADRIVATAANTAIGLASGFGAASGIEEISADGLANVTVTGGTGNDTLNFSGVTLTGIAKILGDAGNDNITGTGGSDWIEGGVGNDTLAGGAGDDTIVGGVGTDALNGGAGGDTYRFTNGDGFDTYADNGTSGTDRIVATAANTAINVASGFGTASGIEEILSGGFANVSVVGSTNGDTLNFSTTTLSGITKIDGGVGNDTITGSAGNDTIVGGVGNDSLRGGAGSDTYQVGAGDGFDGFSDTGTSGTDRIVATANGVAIGLASGFAAASGIEEISANGFANVYVAGGTGNDSLDFSTTTLTGITKIDGDAGNDTITGTSSNDTIVGGVGNDTLRGGGGSDTYQIGVGHGTDTFSDTGTSGTDRIVATANDVAIGIASGFAAASGIEEISSGGFTNASIVGSTNGDTLNFSTTTLTGITKIDGGAGNDTITGSAGNDTIVGGVGNDSLRGGAGSDTYQVGAGDGFDGFSDTGTSGTDRIVATANGVAIGLASGFAAASGIEEISSGGFANVTVVGGTGNDSLNFSNTTLTGITKIDGGTGNDTITGSAGNDTIVGGVGNDTLNGGAGDDTIIGGAGTDQLNGGLGSDTLSYAGSSAGVSVNLTTNAVSGGDAQGDTITAFENLTGSAYNDTLIGSSGANVFHFSLNAGHDVAQARGGIDFIQIDTASGSAGWMEAIASGSAPPLAAGDWLLQLDTGQTFLLHGAGGTYDFGGTHAGVLTAADGSEMQFTEFEGVRW